MDFTLKTFEQLSSIELYNILQLRTEVFVVEQSCPYLEVDGKDLKSYHLFKQQDGEITAYLRILPPGVSYDEVSIGRVLVKKSHRGQGLAQAMLQQALHFIEHKLQETTVKIQAQEYLRKFYGSFGFEAVSEVYLEDNIPHVDMILKSKI